MRIAVVKAWRHVFLQLAKVSRLPLKPPTQLRSPANPCAICALHRRALWREDRECYIITFLSGATQIVHEERG